MALPVPGPPKRGPDFRSVVLKGPPWFFAVLIVIGLGLGLTQFVFSRQTRVSGGEVGVTLLGRITGGGGDETPGGDREDEEQKESALEELPHLTDEPSDFNSLEWLKNLPRKKRIAVPTYKDSPEKSAPPAADPVAATKQDRGGGEGKGRGLGRGEGSPWAHRSGPGRAYGVERYGGTPASENAVESGLDWLARHQDPSGLWDGNSYSKRCLDGGCGKNTLMVDCNVGLTGLSLMAFLGAGYHHTAGRHQRVVARSLRCLLALQDDRGCFSDRESLRIIYNQSLAILALSEALGLTQDQSLFKPLDRGVAFLLACQQENGGWTYTPEPASQRNDTSITGFAVMALRAARKAGIDRGGYALRLARKHIEAMTLPSGEVIYADTGTRAGDRGAGMIAVGLFTSLLLGRPVKHPMIRRQVTLLRARPPRWNLSDDGRGGMRARLSISNSMYYWYYATLSLFCVGGEDWKWWNVRIRDLLIFNQRKKGCAKGSWDPVSLWAENIGRIYATALNVLTLEIYYRYLPSFLLDQTSMVWKPDPSPVSEPTRSDGESEDDRLRRLRNLLDGK